MNRLHKEYNKKLQSYVYKEIDCLSHTDNKACNNRLFNKDDVIMYLFMFILGLVPIILSYINLVRYYG